MIWHTLPEPRPLGIFSPCRSPPSFLGSLSSVRLRRCMRNHAHHCRKLELRQNRHDGTPALAFDPALLSGQGPVERLRRRLAVSGRDDQNQGVCHDDASWSSCPPCKHVCTVLTHPRGQVQHGCRPRHTAASVQRTTASVQRMCVASASRCPARTSGPGQVSVQEATRCAAQKNLCTVHRHAVLPCTCMCMPRWLGRVYCARDWKCTLQQSR